MYSVYSFLQILTVCSNVGGNGKERPCKRGGKIIDVSLSPNQRWEIVEHKVHAYAHHPLVDVVEREKRIDKIIGLVFRLTKCNDTYFFKIGSYQQNFDFTKWEMKYKFLL